MKTIKRRTLFTNEQINHIISFYQQSNSIKKVADFYKCGQSTIKRILLENNIKTLNYDEYFKKFGNNLDLEKITDLYINQNKTRSEIGKIFNIDGRTISYFLRRNGIKPHQQNNQKILEQQKEYIIKLYKDGLYMTEISNIVNICEDSIRHFLQKLGIHTVTSYNCYKFTEKDITIINNLINEDHYILTQIGKIYNCSAPKIAQFCDDNNINRPTNLDQSIKKGFDGNYGCYKRIPYKLSSGNFTYVQGYEYQFLDYIFKNNLFNENEIDYSPTYIEYIENNKNRKYFPDFHIPKHNLIVEIKSQWILERQTALNVLLKEKATREAGFDYILILDNNFKEFRQKYCNISQNTI